MLGFISGTGSDSRTEASPWQTAVRCPITIFIEANNNSELQFEYLLLLLLLPPLPALLFFALATISILNIAYLTNTLVSFQRLTLNGRLKRWKTARQTDCQTDGPHLSHFICIRMLSLVFCLLLSNFHFQFGFSCFSYGNSCDIFIYELRLLRLFGGICLPRRRKKHRQTIAERKKERERDGRLGAREMADSLSAVCSSWYMACLYRLKLKRLFCIYESHMNVNLSIRLLSLSASMNVSSW